MVHPQSVFTYLRAVQQGLRPENEDSTIHSDKVLNAILSYGDVNIGDFVPLLSGALRTPIATEFGGEDVLQVGHRPDVTWGLLNYFGVVTQGDVRDELRIPNRRMQVLVRAC
jgi:hypothetical protein